MELRKAKERIVDLIRVSEEGAKIHPQDRELFLTDKEALETVLKAIEDYKKNLYRVNDENANLKVLIHDLQQQLENSIPKEVVEKKMEELNKGKMDIVTSPIYSRDEKLQILERNRLKKEILQELKE